MPIERSIMLFNGKGGVAKTSIAANLSGLVALGDWRVLVVDLDQQGNLARDLGCMEASDDGEGLLRAAISGVPVAPIKDVRPSLDSSRGDPSFVRQSASYARRTRPGSTVASPTSLTTMTSS